MSRSFGSWTRNSRYSPGRYSLQTSRFCISIRFSSRRELNLSSIGLNRRPFIVSLAAWYRFSKSYTSENFGFSIRFLLEK